MAARALASASIAPPVPAAVRCLRRSKASKPALFATSNGTINKTTAMMVWSPVNNKFFETFSYLPPLTNDQIARQVDYIVFNGWTPCLEFAPSDRAYVNSDSCVRFNGVSANYTDNRYWTMWKLPMFGCTDGDQVLREIASCTRAFPDAYIRLVCFDPLRQVQISGFLVHRPPNARDYKPVNQRSL